MGSVLGCRIASKCVNQYQVIQFVTFWSPSWRSPTTFSRVRFSPSKKGHFFAELPGMRNLHTLMKIDAAKSCDRCWLRITNCGCEKMCQVISMNNSKCPDLAWPTKTCDDKNLQVRFKLSATSPFGLMPLTRHRTAACQFCFKKQQIHSDLCSVTHLC